MPSRPRKSSSGKDAPRKVAAVPEQEAFLAIVRTAEDLLASLNALLKPSDLSSTPYNVLRILRGAEAEGLPCGEIAARMLTHDPDVTRLVDRLLQRALVERRRHEGDRRVVRVSITPAGRAILAELDGPVAELHRRQLGGLGKARLGELVKLLGSIGALKEGS